MNDTLVGVDLAKAVSHLAISSRSGCFDNHRRLTREQFLPFLAQLPAVAIMDACGTAHFWGRKLRELAALARQLPAVERLMQIPGIWLIIATALVGFVGDLRRFPSARHLASYLGPPCRCQ